LYATHWATTRKCWWPSRHGRPAPSNIFAMAEICGVPDVIDFPRDIQPILDEHCVAGHEYERTAAGGPRDSGVSTPTKQRNDSMKTLTGLFLATILILGLICLSGFAGREPAHQEALLSLSKQP